MRDTCGLLIAGQGAARGDRRATGDLRDPLALARDTCFAISTGFYRKPAAFRTAIVLRGSRSRPEARLTLAATCSVAGCSV